MSFLSKSASASLAASSAGNAADKASSASDFSSAITLLCSVISTLFTAATFCFAVAVSVAEIFKFINLSGLVYFKSCTISYYLNFELPVVISFSNISHSLVCSATITFCTASLAFRSSNWTFASSIFASPPIKRSH